MHLNLTRRRPRFALDRDAARAFLAGALRRYDHNNIGVETEDYGEGWELRPGWQLDKLWREDLPDVGNLVYYAILEGAIICPKGLDLDLNLDLIISAGEYGDHMYDWRVGFASERDRLAPRFSLCMPYRREFKSLGYGDGHEPKGTGCKNAWWVLYEAVEEANWILDAYRRGHGRPGPARRTLRETASRWLVAARAAARKVANRDA